MSANTEMEKTDNADDREVEDVNSAVIHVEEKMRNMQITPIDNCEGVIVQLRSSLEINNAVIFAFVDFAECVAEFVTSVIRSYHGLLALTRCIHDAEEYKMQREIYSSNNSNSKYKIKHLSCNTEDQALLIEDMLTLFHHILSPYDAAYHHPCWLFVNEEVEMTLADRINYFQEWWRCHSNINNSREESQKPLVEQTKSTLTEQVKNDSETQSSKMLTSPITSKESIMPAEFIIMMWHELYNTLGASWRQRKRLFHDLQWTFQYHAKHYTFANVHYYSGSANKTYKYNEDKLFNIQEKYKNEEDEEDVIAFGPLTPASIGISTSSRCVIRCPLNSFWRTLAIVSIIKERNIGNNIDSCTREIHTYLFDESVEDVALSHAIPYLSPQCYYNYVISHNKNINTMNDNSHDTKVHYEKQQEEEEEYEKTTRIAHSYSDDVWNVSILILEIALCGFDVNCLMPRYQTLHNYKTQHYSVYTEIIHFLISEHHMLPQSAENFVYAALHHFERLVLSLELEENEPEEQWRQQYKEGMELSPEHLAQQWLLYLRKAYGNDFVNLFFTKEVVLRALRWRRQDRWSAFISTFGTKRKKEKEEKVSLYNNDDDSENKTNNKEINVAGKVFDKENKKPSLLTAVHTPPNFFESEHMAALIALPSVKELMRSKTERIVDDKSIMPLWNHFNLSWWDECQSWINNVVNHSMAELDVRACHSTYRRITFDSYLHLITRYIASLFVTNLENYTSKLSFCIAMHPFLRELRRLQQLRLLHLATQQTFMYRKQKWDCKINSDKQLLNYVDYHNSQQHSEIFLSSSFIQQFTNSANDELHRRLLYKQMELDENFLEWEENMCNDVDDMNVDLDKYLSDLQITETELHSDSSESEEGREIKMQCEVENTDELQKNKEENSEVTWEDTELNHIAELRSVILEQITSWENVTNTNVKEIVFISNNNNNNVNKSSHVVNDFLVQKYWEWYFVNETNNKTNNVNNEEEEELKEWWVYSPIPPTLRSVCWFALLQTHSCSLSATTKLSQIEEHHLMKNKINLELEEEESELQEGNNCFFMEECPWDVHSCVLSFERQLSVDLPRCHQESFSLHTPEAHASLRRCIRGWYRLNNEEWSYWQGIDSLAAVLFSITPFDEKIVTWELHEMIQTFVAHDFDHEPNLGHKAIQKKINEKSKNAMTCKKTLKDMHEFLHALTLLLHYVDPELAQHLFNNVKCDVHLFAVGWFVTLFAHHFSLDEVYLIWDVLLAHSFHYSHCLLCIAAAFILVRRSILLHGDFVVCLSALNHINKQHNMLGDNFQDQKYNMKNRHDSIVYIHSVLSVALKMMYAFPSSVIEKSCSAPYYLNSHECVYSCNTNTYFDKEYNADKVKRRTTETVNDSDTFTSYNNTTINEKELEEEEYMFELNKAQQMYEVQLLPVSVVISAFRHEPLRWDFMAEDNVYHDRPPHWTDSGVFIVEVDIMTNSDSTTTISGKQHSDEVKRESIREYSVHELHNKRLVGALHVQLDLRTMTITNEEQIHHNEKLEKEEQENREEHDKERSYETKETEKKTLRVHKEQKVNLSHIERARLMQDAAVSLSEQLHHVILATIPPLSVYCANNKQNKINNVNTVNNNNNKSNNEDANVIDELINAPHVILVHTATNNSNNGSTRSVHDLRDNNQRSKSALEQNYLYLQEFAMQLQKYKVPHVSILFGEQSALYDALPHLFVEKEVSSRTRQI